MTPEKFIATWQSNSLSEKGGAQPHFEDLCRLLNVDPPRKYGEYCYEQDLEKLLGGKGFADVWKKGCFGWENKGPAKDLGPALMQLKNYAGAMENPPVLVVCNRERIEIHPCFTGYPSTPRIILLEDIGRPENLQALKWLFSPTDVNKLRPVKSNAAITAEAAAELAKVAKGMRARGLEGQQVAHFLIQCIFCMYAEDEAILHEGDTDNPQIFSAILKSVKTDVDRARQRLTSLFKAMKTGGQYGNDDIAWFNGGLFKQVDVPALLEEDLDILRYAAESLDWRAVDPTIFGTLFERGLDPQSRAPLGAHYTDTTTIEKLIRPLIVDPLAAEWKVAKATMELSVGKGKRSDAYKNAVAAYQSFLERLRNFRVLDPACGSGNFLYLAMRALKDLEHAAQIDAELMGFGRQIGIETGPANVLGIEINEYAAELARVTVWIGDIQWSRGNGRPVAKDPILRSLDGIQHRDALIAPDKSYAEWPEADVIVGNPPFLGDKRMRSELGDAYTDSLRKLYASQVPGGGDLVCYWFFKAREHIQSGKSACAGLVATNSIRGGANRRVLDDIAEQLAIFDAWSDEAWVNQGAAVRVSLVAFTAKQDAPAVRLNGQSVNRINSDLTSSGPAHAALDLRMAKVLSENAKTAFQGITKGGAFDIPGKDARAWLSLTNPNGRGNADVLRPWQNGLDVTRRSADNWIIDFSNVEEEEAMLYEQPFQHILQFVKPERDKVSRERRRRLYWQFNETARGMRKSISSLGRFIVTPEVSKHRVFAWLQANTIPDKNLIVFARSDDVMFGILHSRFHEIWSLRMGTSLEDRPRYTNSTVFETFPFPHGLAPADSFGEPIDMVDYVLPPVGETVLPVARNIAAGAARLNTLRETWLNPKEWVERVSEIAANLPERIVPKKEHVEDVRVRTLTNLYNAKPAWLVSAHLALDRAVATAYGWSDYVPAMSDEEILTRLLAINKDRHDGSPTV